MISTKKLQRHQHYHQVKLICIYEYLKGEEILPSDQSRVIEKAKLTNSLLGKAFEKHIKTIESRQGGK